MIRRTIRFELCGLCSEKLDNRASSLVGGWSREYCSESFTHAASYAQKSAAQSLNAEITGVRISADRRPVVTFKIHDGQGRALELSDLDDGSIRFTIAAIKADSNGQTGYHNYILTKVTGKEYVYKGEIKKPLLAETLQPDFDNGGALTRLRPGVFTYTFKTALPANYDRHATHVLGGELTRDKGKFVANPLFEFVPSGGKVKTQRAVVETASCNNCHDPLKHHGGAKREAGYCALCHTPLSSPTRKAVRISNSTSCPQDPPWQAFAERARRKTVFYCRGEPTRPNTTENQRLLTKARLIWTAVIPVYNKRLQYCGRQNRGRTRRSNSQDKRGRSPGAPRFFLSGTTQRYYMQ
jgi:hypothetical protein